MPPLRTVGSCRITPLDVLRVSCLLILGTLLCVIRVYLHHLPYLLPASTCCRGGGAPVPLRASPCRVSLVPLLPARALPRFSLPRTCCAACPVSGSRLLPHHLFASAALRTPVAWITLADPPRFAAPWITTMGASQITWALDATLLVAGFCQDASLRRLRLNTTACHSLDIRGLRCCRAGARLNARRLPPPPEVTILGRSRSGWRWVTWVAPACACL